jgi:hypothetical protein
MPKYHIFVPCWLYNLMKLKRKECQTWFEEKEERR